MKMLRLPSDNGANKVETALNPAHVIAIDQPFRMGAAIVGECIVTLPIGQVTFKCSYETAVSLWEDAMVKPLPGLSL